MRTLLQLAVGTGFCVWVTALAASGPEDAVIALQKAAAGGDARALTELGVRYENAEGVPRDQQKASALYCQAARQGDPEALFRLGWLYANGRGQARDDAVAAALFRMASDAGHEYAGRMLQYVHPQPDTRLPSCLLPDPPVVVASPAKEYDEKQGPNADYAIAAKRHPEIVRLVRTLAPQYSVDAQLVLAMIVVESDFDARAVSPKNAQGLMQLIPETAARFGVKRVFNAADNLKGGLSYLRWLLALFQGDVRLVVAAYNAGEGAVEKYRGIPPYAETRNYVARITSLYKKAHHPYEVGIVAPSPVITALRRQ